jgi:DNA-binding GntR family transcriptional regulator
MSIRLTAGLERETLTEKVAIKLRDSIVLGTLSPGTRLVETELAQQLGVSKNTLREALRTLQTEGLIEYRPHRGTVVASLTEQDIVEFFSLRSILEGLAARRVAEFGSAEQMAKLRAQAGELIQAAESGDARRTNEMDLRLHQTIWELSGHRLLQKMLNGMQNQILMHMLVNPNEGMSLVGFIAPHESLIDAIASGDPDAAEREMREHIDSAQRATLASRRLKAKTAGLAEG